jgi:acetylornithine deacetylase/succinyl-diaminopimelate desuccinylase-like protein
MPRRSFPDVWADTAAARRAVEAADDHTLSRQVHLATIPAPTGAEQGRAQFVARQFKNLGLERVSTDTEGNVLGWLGPRDGAAVVVCAHLDTVFPADIPHKIVSQGPRLVGPGIGDNARGLSAMLTIAAALKRHTPTLTSPILFAATRATAICAARGICLTCWATAPRVR